MRRLLALLVFVIACPKGEPTSNNNPNNPPPPPPPSGNQNATVRIEIRGLTGQEAAMEVRYAVASGPITRAAESVIPRPAPIQYCISVGSTQTCEVLVPIGQSITLYAYEGFDGTITPVAPGNGFTLQGIMHEFVSFTGNDCLQPVGFQPSECAVTPTTARVHTVRADFTIMPTFRVRSIGMTGASGTVTARDVRGLPVRPNIFTEAGIGGSSNTDVVVAEGAFAFGTEITLTAQPRNQAKFIRWEGCKTGTGGTNPTCTLPSSVSGTAPATVKIVGEYWQCAVGIADGPGSGCTLIRP